MKALITTISAAVLGFSGLMAINSAQADDRQIYEPMGHGGLLQVARNDGYKRYGRDQRHHNKHSYSRRHAPMHRGSSRHNANRWNHRNFRNDRARFDHHRDRRHVNRGHFDNRRVRPHVERRHFDNRRHAPSIDRGRFGDRHQRPNGDRNHMDSRRQRPDSDRGQTDGRRQRPDSGRDTNRPDRDANHRV